MEPYQIILLILLLLAFFYASVLLVAVSHAREFRLRLKNRMRAMSIILSEQADLLSLIVDMFAAQKVDFGADAEVCQSIHRLDFSKANSERNLENLKVVKTVHSRISYLGQENRWATKDPRYAAYMDTFSDLERNLRQTVALYNSDVDALNYWLRVPTAAWFLWICGFRKRKMIS